MAKTKIKSKSIKKRDALKRTSRVFRITKFIVPFVPAGVMSIINWDEWFAETGGSLPAGLLMAIFSALIVCLGVTKRDELIAKKLSPIFVLTVGVAIAGVSCLLLASILHELGIMLLVSAIGAAVAGTEDQLNMSLIEPEVKEYSEIILEAGMDEKENKKKAKREKIKAELEEARRRATE